MSFLFINNTLRLNNIKNRKAMNAKISVFVICVEATIYLLLYNLHDCTFNSSFFPSIMLSTAKAASVYSCLAHAVE